MKTQLLKIALGLLIFSCFNVNGQSVQLNWAAHDGGPGINEDYASGTTQDAQGNTYITGMVAEAMGLSVINSIMTVKLDPNGDVLWKKYYINPTGDNCYPTGIAYDGSSAIYITGNALDGSQHSQIILMKYDLSGSLQWIRQYSDPATDSDLSNGIAIGSANQIYLAASCQDSLATTSQFRTIKYDANGNFQWQKDFSLGFTGANQASAICADASGNCYVAGNCRTANQYNNVVTVSYNSAGSVNWSSTKYTSSNDYAVAIIRSSAGNIFTAGSLNNYATVTRYTSGGNEDWSNYTTEIYAYSMAHDIAVDPSGNAYITGTYYFTVNNDLTTVKFNTTGTPTTFVYGTANDYEAGISVECDAAGFIYTMGYSNTGGHYDYCLLKHNNSGSLQWNKTVTRSVSYDSYLNYLHGQYLSVDAGGTFTIAGFDFQLLTAEDFLCTRFSGSGAIQWNKLISRSNNSYDFPSGSVMDADRNIYVTGSGEGRDGGLNVYTVCYDKHGAKRWEDLYIQLYETGESSIIAVDNNQNTYVAIYAGGYNFNPIHAPGNPTYRMRLVKYDPNGNRVWDIYTPEEVYPADIKIDQNGNIYVLGTLNYSVSPTEIILKKYDPSGTETWSRTLSWMNDNYGISLALDDQATSYAAFTSFDNLGFSDAVVATWDVNGNPGWTSGYLGFGGSPDAHKIKVDSLHNCFLFVESITGLTDRDMSVEKFDASGSFRMEVRYDGPSHLADFCYDMEIDNHGFAYITGSTSSPTTDLDMVVAKLDMNGNVGSIDWSTIYDSPTSGYDHGNKITTDPFGNIYASGLVQPLNQDADFIIFKYDGNGSELWRTIYNAPADGFHTPDAGIFSTGLGEVYVAGHGLWDDSTSSDYITLKYCETPVISANGNTSFCPGGSVVLSVPQAYTYEWSTGETTQSISVNAAGTYTVTSNGCATSLPTTITVYTPPTATINPSGIVDICDGDITTLTSSSASAYVWTPGGASTPSIQVSNSGSYVVTVTDNHGCSATSPSTQVIVHSLPVVSISPSNPAPICLGDTIALTSTPGVSYLWSPGNETTSYINVWQSANYFVSVTDNNGCTGSSAPVTLTVNPLPNPTFSLQDTICIHDTLVLNANPTGGIFSGPGVVNNVFHTDLSGQGSVTLTYSYTDPGTGCSASVDQSIFVDVCSGITMNPASSTGLAVYPNPASMMVQIDLNLISRDNIQLNVLDISGRLIRSIVNEITSSGNHLYNFSTEELANGVYYITLQSDHQQAVVRLCVNN